MSAVEEKVKSIVVAQLGVTEDQVTKEAKFIEDLGADSIELVDLIMSVEEEYDIEVPDDAADEIRTVGDAVRFIENLVD